MKTSDLDILRKLTLVVPTWNQPFELERAIEYWRATPITVYILDGSDTPWFPIGELRDASNIKYFHIPVEKTQNPIENFFQRINFGLELPTTRYVAFGCDDDFYTITGLIASLKTLEAQPAIDAVAGHVLTYERKRRIVWHHKYVPRFTRTDLEVQSIEKKLATGSAWFLYAVCRVETWQKFLKISYEKQDFTSANYFAHEWIMTLLSKAMFRTKYISAIQLVRRDTILGRNKEPSTPWGKFILDSQNAESIDEIVNQLSKGFNEVTPQSEHAKNLELAREQMRLEQEKALRAKALQQKSKKLKSILGDILFFFLPGLNVFSDRPRRLKYLWRIPRYQYSAEQQKEVEEIEKLLLKPREELRLRANI